MRIGEVLIEQRKLTSGELTRVLSEQPRDGRRLASLLIARGVIDFDDASRALGAQRGVPCALGRHLAARDPGLAALVPPNLAHARYVLPLGRASNGTLIVCARDPSPELRTEVARAIGADVTLVIVPAARLAELLVESYGPAPAPAPAPTAGRASRPARASTAVEEFEVDVASGVQEFDVDFSSAVEAPAPSLPPQPDVDTLDPASVRLALTDLDDARVTKDPSQSGQMNAMSGLLALPKAPPPTLDATRTALERAGTRDAATDAVMAFIAGSWVAGAVLAIRGGTAVGFRGHGPAIGTVETLGVPLDQPSTVRAAVETRRSSIRLYDSPPQRELARRLGSSSMAAAPVVVDSQVVAAIAVGEPIQGLGDTDRWIAELGRLAQLLGQAYARIRGGG